MTTAALQPSSVKLLRNGDANDFSMGISVGKMKAFALHDLDLSLDQWQLNITNNLAPSDKMQLIIRYILKG